MENATIGQIMFRMFSLDIGNINEDVINSIFDGCHLENGLKTFLQWRCWQRQVKSSKVSHNLYTNWFGKTMGAHAYLFVMSNYFYG